MLKAIFYARFHPERGPSVIHQYPNGSVIPSAQSNESRNLLTFSDISAYIIPPYELCDRPLSICSNGYRVMGFPISLEDPKYERNRFTFNVCFVVSETEDLSESWERIVRKTAAFFTSLEEEDGLLSAEERLEDLKWAGDVGYPAQNIGVVYTLLENIVDDLNAYHETCAYVTEQHVLNLRLESTVKTKKDLVSVQAWQVPILIRALPSPEQWTWCMTIQRIHRHIDGINHVRRIAELADVELKLVKRAIRELIYHDRLILLDIFHFQAIYALTKDFAWFVQDEVMQAECLAYITVDPSRNPLAVATDSKSEKDASSLEPTTEIDIVDLYTSLSPGVTLHDFVLTKQPALNAIDMRRFITFGLIKGFLRRIHKYAFTLSPSTSTTLALTNKSSPSKSGSKPKSNEDAVRDFDRAWKKAALTSGWATPPADPPPRSLEAVGSARSADELRTEEDEKLRSFLDGKHCLDEICVEMSAGEKRIVERVKSGRFGEVMVFCK